jgi:hypothetical protein
LRGLNGLEPKDLKRITGIDFNKNAASVSKALKNQMSSLSLKGRVNETLRANDHLMCDVGSSDIWVKLKIFIDAEASNYLEAELEIKISKFLNGESF